MRLRALAFALALATALVAAAIGYLHTGHAFRRVVVPLADAWIDGELTAERGRITWTGHVEAREAGYEAPGIRLRIATLSADLSPWSLFARDRVRIESLEAAGVEVSWTDAGPDAGTDGRDAPTVDGAEDFAGWTAAWHPVPVPVEIGRARVEGVLERRSADGTQVLRLDAGRLRAEGILPDSEGVLDLEADVVIESQGGLGWRGPVELRLVTSGGPAAGIGRIRGSGSLEIEPLGGSEEPALALELDLDRALAEKGPASLRLSVVATRASAGLGSLEVELGPHEAGASGTGAAAPTADGLRVRAALDDVTHELLTPVAVALGQPAFEAGRVRGSLEGDVDPRTDAFRIRSQWEVRDLVRAGESGAAGLQARSRAEVSWSPSDASATGAATGRAGRLEVAILLDSLAADALGLRLGESDLRAVLDLEASGERPRIRGELRSERLTFLEGPARDPDAAQGESEALDAALPFESLPEIDARARVSVGRLALGRDVLEEVTGEAVLGGGRLALVLDRGGLWGGEISGAFSADWSAEAPVLALQSGLRGANVGRFFEGQQADGTLDVAIDARGSGATLRALLAGSEGAARVRLGTIEFEGEPLGGLGKGLFRLLFENLQPGHQDRLHCAVVHGRFEDGLGKLGVVIDTPTTTLAGGGGVDLRAREADVILKPRTKDVSVGAVRTPIRVWGPLDDLQTGLDAEGVAMETAKLVAFGLVNPVLIVVPLIDFGTGEDNPCEKALDALQQEPAPPPTLLERATAPFEPVTRPFQGLRGWLAPDATGESSESGDSSEAGGPAAQRD